jgi:hypothetical protein
MLGLAPDGVCPATAVARHAGGLLHHRFTLTPTAKAAGRSALCCTLPSNRFAWELPSIVLCGVRTFLNID